MSEDEARLHGGGGAAPIVVGEPLTMAERLERARAELTEQGIVVDSKAWLDEVRGDD